MNERTSAAKSAVLKHVAGLLAQDCPAGIEEAPWPRMSRASTRRSGRSVIRSSSMTEKLRLESVHPCRKIAGVPDGSPASMYFIVMPVESFVVFFAFIHSD